MFENGIMAIRVMHIGRKTDREEIRAIGFYSFLIMTCELRPLFS